MIPDLQARLVQLLRTRTAKDTLTNAAGTGVSAVLAFAVLVVATNAMGPAMYGRFAIALTVLMLTSELADLGLNAGLIRHASAHLGRGELHAASTILSVALRAKLATALLGAGVVAVGADLLASWLGRPEAAPLLRIAAVGLAGAVLQGYVSAVLQAHQLFLRNAVLQMLSWTLRLAGTLFLAARGELDPASLLWVYASAPWIAFGTGLVLAPRSSITVRLWDAERARQVLRFSRWIALWALLWSLLLRLDLLLLGRLSTDEQVGYYATSERIVTLASMLVGAYLMTLIPKLSRVADGAGLRRGMRTAFQVSLGIAGIIALGIPAAPWIVRLFGPEFAPAAPVLAVRLLGSVFHALTLSFNAGLFALNRPYVFSVAGVLGLTTSVAGNVWLIPRFGAMATAGVGALVGLELLLVAWAATRFYLPPPEARLAPEGSDGPAQEIG